MKSIQFPEIVGVQQQFPVRPRLDITATLEKEFEAQKIIAKLKRGNHIAVAVGSRGITNLADIVSVVIHILRAAGTRPFIVPAMGSHGGATPRGQKKVLAAYGITKERLGVPIESAMDVQTLGSTSDGVNVYFSTAALRADGIVVVNRVKPHTDFSGAIGSGIMKMVAIGLGKRAGASACHAAASRLGHEHVIRTVARITLRSAPIVCGVAILENEVHETARLVVLKPDEIEEREEALLRESKALMPRLPFDDIDLLIVDRIGKDISGAGMDPNVIGRAVQGYSSFLGRDEHLTPFIRRILILDLTRKANGNAIGIGLADFTTSRMIRTINQHSTYINALTSLTPQMAKMPIHFETDREAITQTLYSLALEDTRQAKLVRVADTLSLEKLQISTAYLDEIRQRRDLVLLTPPQKMRFDSSGNLSPLSFD